MIPLWHRSVSLSLYYCHPPILTDEIQIHMVFLHLSDTLLRCAFAQLEINVLKILSAALLLGSGMALSAGSASALQTIVTHVDKNADGTTTYHFAVKMDPGETLTPGDAKISPDFVTVYNFFGLINGSVKSPEGWVFSSEEFGRTPHLNGYPMVLPVDVPNTPNLTWTVTKPVAAGAQIDGFSATTHVGMMVEGGYSAQVTRQAPAIQGPPAGTQGAAATISKQALIGALATPSFLASEK
jgi:hypothetical protein